MGGAVWMQTWSELRARWRGALAVAILFGLAGSIAMTPASRHALARVLVRPRS